MAAAASSPLPTVLQPGATAPDLALLSDDGQTVQLSAVWQVRPLVLAFLHDLPNPFTGDHAAQLRDAAAAFEKAGAGLAAVCAAGEGQAAAFADRLSLPYPLLCDPQRAAYARFAAGGAATFIVDTTGRVRFARAAVNAADYPSGTQLVEAICAVTGAEPPPPPAPSPALAAVAALAPAVAGEPSYVCPKCGYMACAREEMATAGGFLSRLFNVQHRKFTAVVCAGCGYTELYRGTAGALGNVVDFLGG
jgi:predicted nucleic-acid-binding Zn-ribbon protein/peroxiredoxin